MRILTEEKNNGRLSLTDAGDFDGGDLIECIKWNNHDDYRQFDPIITGVCDRFNAGYDGFKVRYIIEKESRISLPEAVFTLMQVMSILGELGITIKR
ncbi:MAG: hypothetical protein IJV00_06750 [Clostridia bacterium]|nr:hypothetical protein [Clostridia bacterium]